MRSTESSAPSFSAERASSSEEKRRSAILGRMAGPRAFTDSGTLSSSGSTVSGAWAKRPDSSTRPTTLACAICSTTMREVTRPEKSDIVPKKSGMPTSVTRYPRRVTVPTNSWRATAATLRRPGRRIAPRAPGIAPTKGSPMEHLRGGGGRVLLGDEAHEDLLDAGDVRLEGGHLEPAPGHSPEG